MTNIYNKINFDNNDVSQSVKEISNKYLIIAYKIIFSLRKFAIDSEQN